MASRPSVNLSVEEKPGEETLERVFLDRRVCPPFGDYCFIKGTSLLDIGVCDDCRSIRSQSNMAAMLPLSMPGSI